MVPGGARVVFMEVGECIPIPDDAIFRRDTDGGLLTVLTSDSLDLKARYCCGNTNNNSNKDDGGGGGGGGVRRKWAFTDNRVVSGKQVLKEHNYAKPVVSCQQLEQRATRNGDGEHDVDEDENASLFLLQTASACSRGQVRTTSAAAKANEKVRVKACFRGL